MDDLENITPATFDADATARTLGLSEKQKTFALSILRGANQTQAAREAGYQGTPEQLRSAGHTAAKSAKVQRFIELAALEGGGIVDLEVDPTERRRLLSKMARGSDKNTALRAIEVLEKLDVASDARRAEETQGGTVQETLAEIASLSPTLALYLAKKYQADWVPSAEIIAAANAEALRMVEHRYDAVAMVAAATLTQEVSNG